jgi:hypothetical protein
VGRIGGHDELVELAMMHWGDFNVTRFSSERFGVACRLAMSDFLISFMIRAVGFATCWGVFLLGLFLRIPQSGQGSIIFLFLLGGKLGSQVPRCHKRDFPDFVRIIFLSFLIV